VLKGHSFLILLLLLILIKGLAVPTQPVIITTNLNDIPSGFPSVPPDEWKTPITNPTPDEYKLNIRRKMHREEWENSLGIKLNYILKLYIKRNIFITSCKYLFK
jgi:hypothetical protein